MLAFLLVILFAVPMQSGDAQSSNQIAGRRNPARSSRPSVETMRKAVEMEEKRIADLKAQGKPSDEDDDEKDADEEDLDATEDDDETESDEESDDMDDEFIDNETLEEPKKPEEPGNDEATAMEID